MAIGKIICLARTYQKHAEEMGVMIPKTPILFLKPASAVIFSGEKILYPPQTTCLHHEIELGVVIGRQGFDIPIVKAMDYISGYCVALDITARDLQAEAKKQGLPWSIAKGFDTFAPISKIADKNEIVDPHEIELVLMVNDEIRQKDSTANMMWNIPELISFISSIMHLERGDLILTGTPKGVSEIRPGDSIKAEAGDVCSLEVSVIKK